MKKKTVSLLVALAMCVLFASCGNSSSATPDSASKKSEVTATIEQTTTLAPTTIPPTTVPSTTAPPTTVHTHQWESITSTIHHDAVSEQVWVVDKPAETRECIAGTYTCKICLRKFEYDSGINSDIEVQEIKSLAEQHKLYEQQKYEKAKEYFQKGITTDYPDVPGMGYYSYKYEKTFPEEGHNENRITKEAYDETVVTGQKCKTCGEFKAVEN